MSESAQRPNVVLIVSDDHGYADRTALGIHPDVRTPRLDQLAAEGLSCTQAYVTAPICSPSRAAIISGQYQQRWGALWFESSRFPDHLPTLAERFAGLGYATGYFGKVHYGPEQPGDRACPPRHGFAESYYGLAGRQQGRLHYLHHTHDAVARYGPEAAWRMGVYPMYEGDDEAEYDGFITAEFGRRAREFVAGHADQAFFLTLAFNAVHNFTFQLPDDELARRGLPGFDDLGAGEDYPVWYEDAIWPNLPHGRDYYLAQLELMDHQIGLLLDQLEASGLTENTIVVYLTDNGGSTCNFGDNAPLRGGKYSLWEGGIRTPWFVRWPAGGISGGRQTDMLTSSLDLFPTLLAAAGAPAAAYGHCDGISQLSSWQGRVEEPAKSRALHWDCGFQWAVRDDGWKLHVVHDGPQREQVHRVQHSDIGNGVRLTRITDDAGESKDLTEEHPDIVDRLTTRHRSWRRRVGLPEGVSA